MQTPRINVLAAPRYTHDCPDCKFVGRFGDADIYICMFAGEISSIIARTGNEPSEYGSGYNYRPDSEIFQSLWRAGIIGVKAVPGETLSL